MCLPKVEYIKASYQGGYYEEFGIMQISLNQTPMGRFVTFIHEMGHWLLFRLGRTDLVYTMNVAWDYIWAMTVDSKIFYPQ